MALNDNKNSKLVELGYSGAVPNMESSFYGDRGGTGNFNDRQMSFLAAQGFGSGSLADRWYAYLKSLGYTGTLIDMMNSFWLNYSEGGSFRILTEAGDFLQLETGTDYLRT